MFKQMTVNTDRTIDNRTRDQERKLKLLEVKGVTVSYRGNLAIENVNLDLNQGEIGAIVGPSGCGKSTLLRCIVGFERPQEGTVSMNGKMLASPSFSTLPEKRGIGMVFQDITLFPHLNIHKNIAFGLRDWKPQEINLRVNELLKLINLPSYANRHPNSLSGGEQQRVALARAMAPKPKLLLLDEAFSSLDHELRQSLVPEIREILNFENMSALIVTHDQDEAFAIADRVGVMESGKIHQWDTSYKLYHQPKTKFTARFIGKGTFTPATVLDSSRVETVFGIHELTNYRNLHHSNNIEMLLRPDDLLLDKSSSLQAKLVRKSFRGSHYFYRIEMKNGQTAYCLADSHHNHRVGQWIGIRPNIEHVVLFGAEN